MAGSTRVSTIGPQKYHFGGFLGCGEPRMLKPSYLVLSQFLRKESGDRAPGRKVALLDSSVLENVGVEAA